MKQKVNLALGTLILLLHTGCHGNQKNKNNMEKEAINTVKTVFSETDQRNWAQVEAQMASTVWLDYASLSGQPGSTVRASDIIAGWKSVLPGFERTHHQLSNFEAKAITDGYQLTFHGKADHYLNDKVWTVLGGYRAEVNTAGHRPLMTQLVFNLEEQTGELSLAAQAMDNIKSKQKQEMETQLKAGTNKVSFPSEGETLVGNLYLPKNYSVGQLLPGVIVTGSWTTVKEQMAATYAQEVADLGYAALTFDFRYFGESGGTPRQWENPEAKITDIQHAMDFMAALSIIKADEIGGLGICASAGYMVGAVTTDNRFKTIALVAPWLHNAEIVRQIYGGEEGVSEKIKRSKAAEKLYKEKGVNDFVPVASITDKNAIMDMELAVDNPEWNYYVNDKRGAIKEWSNQLQLMSWEPWLTFDGVKYANQMKLPILMICSEGMAVPQGAKDFYANLTAPKEAVWLDGYMQLDYYDQPKAIKESMEAVKKHFDKTL